MPKFVSISTAAEQLRSANRILVIGCSGSGKSTLSQKLCRRLGLPYISMDRDVFWLAGWKMRPRAEIVERMKAFVAGERWLIDGNSPGTLPIRLQRTEFVVWLRPPRWVSVYGILSRWIRYRGQTRPEQAEGCPEKMDWPFFRYVWNFEKTEVPEILGHLDAAGAELPVLVLKSHAESHRLLAILDRGH
ncbi:AAA family ATPase [Rhizobium sp. CG5]|uniref:AAA family ATPase n=1 Tax=Rhizobium sp. CG5 TaxID=2726076 RepID=UPI002033CE55|nr:AAA family ATPase [Rhizobium sp. CG5]MCM2474805.1 AAA family ATPase [Rhizobium sp. CG5]